MGLKLLWAFLDELALWFTFELVFALGTIPDWVVDVQPWDLVCCCALLGTIRNFSWTGNIFPRLWKDPWVAHLWNPNESVAIKINLSISKLIFFSRQNFSWRDPYLSLVRVQTTSSSVWPVLGERTFGRSFLPFGQLWQKKYFPGWLHHLLWMCSCSTIVWNVKNQCSYRSVFRAC